MTTKTTSHSKTGQHHSNTKARARAVAREGVDVRNRVRDLTVAAIRDGNLTARDISRLVDDVLEGAAAGLDAALPSSRNSVLRQVFEGLNDAMGAVSKTGGSLMRGMRTRGKTILDHDLPNAKRHVVSAGSEFLNAVGRFASRVSGEMGEELNHLVSRARRDAPRVAHSAARAASAADGRVLELGEEAAAAGMQVARRAVGGLAKAASGLLEGIAVSLAPERPARARARKPSSTPGKTASPRGARKPKRRASKARVATRRAPKRKPGRRAP